MRKIIVLGLFLLFAGSMSWASDIYVAQTATGGANGADCSNARSASWFNTATNWGSNTSQIGAGTTVHLCGKITVPLTVAGSGASGNPIKILFESGARLSQPAMVGNFLNLGSNDHIVVDGNGVGIIENTANGTGLANQVNGSVGVNYAGSSDVEIKNLTCQNLYVHAKGSPDPIDHTTINCIKGGGGSTIRIHDNVLHDVGWAIYTINSSADSDVQIYKNSIYRIDHGISITAASSGNKLSGLSIHDNHIYSYANWDCGGGCHHDGIHMYGTGSSAVNGFQLYNNLFEGPVGVSLTAHLFMEHGGSDAHVSNFNIYNNVATTDDNSNLNNGLLGIFSGDSGINQVYNNTLVGASNSSGLCLSVANIVGLKLKNNAISNCNQIIRFTNNSYGSSDVDYNVYGNLVGSNSFYKDGSFYGSLSSWRTAASADAHSSSPLTMTLDALTAPLLGSPVVGAATNLSALGIATLSLDKLGQARPSSGAWDAGAYASGSSSGSVQPPQSLVATVN